MNLCVLGVVLIMLGELREIHSKEMLNMLEVTKIVLLRSILMILIHLNGVQYMFNIDKLTQSLFSDSIDYGVQDPRTSYINLVQMNTRIIERN